MKEDYLDSKEFKEILEKYEASKEQGNICYFDADDYIDIADSYMMNGMPDNALCAVNTGLDQHPGYTDLMSAKSGTLIYMHRFDEAREIIDTLPPDDGNVLYQRAQLAYALDNDIPASEELFTDWLDMEEKCSENDTDDEPGERLRDAYMHVITSFIELCETNYDEELVKRWVEAYYARFAPLGKSNFDLMLADTVRNENLPDMVEMVYSSLLEYDPYINYGWEVLATSQVMNGHFQEAIESADFALAVDPNNTNAILTKAHANYSLGHKLEALPLFERFLSLIDDPNQYITYSHCLIAADRLEEAKPYLDKAEKFIRNFKEQPDYYGHSNFELAQAYLNYDPKKAKICIERAVKIFPEELDYLMLQGTIYRYLKKIKLCIATFRKCISLAEDKVLIVCEIAYRFAMLSDFEASHQILGLLDPISKDDPSYRIVSGYNAYFYLQEQKYQDFLYSLKKACKECPDIVQRFFSRRFPATVEPKDYFNYIIKTAKEDGIL